MRFVTYISALPKKYQTAAENMSNLIQEIFHISYAAWKLNYIKSKIRWMFPSYIGNATSLTNIFGPKKFGIKEILYNFYRERLRINILYKLQKRR